MELNDDYFSRMLIRIKVIHSVIGLLQDTKGNRSAMNSACLAFFDRIRKVTFVACFCIPGMTCLAADCLELLTLAASMLSENLILFELYRTISSYWSRSAPLSTRRLWKASNIPLSSNSFWPCIPSKAAAQQAHLLRPRLIQLFRASSLTTLALSSRMPTRSKAAKPMDIPPHLSENMRTELSRSTGLCQSFLAKTMTTWFPQDTVSPSRTSCAVNSEKLISRRLRTVMPLLPKTARLLSAQG